METLCDLYGTQTITQTIINCNLRKKVDWPAVQMQVQMQDRDFTVSAMHVDMDQKEREVGTYNSCNNATTLHNIIIDTSILNYTY